MTKYTMIDSLPDISDLENDIHGRSERVRPPLGKNTGMYQFDDDNSAPFSGIRPPQQPPHPQSGMGSIGGTDYMNPYRNSAPQPYQQTAYPSNYHVNEYYKDTAGNAEGRLPQPTEFYDDLNCKDVAQHVEKCKVCSRLYRTDITIYVICIAILIVICLLLLKRVLDL